MIKRLHRFISRKAIPALTGDSHAPHVYLTHLNYLNYRQLSRSLEASLPYARGVMLDVGSGRAPYRRFFEGRVERYIAVDKGEVNRATYGDAALEFVDADAGELPFESGSADTLLLTQVLEHVPDPNAALAEMARVLRSGGVLLISAPFIFYEHLSPYDYFRYSRHGLRHLLETHGFEMVEFHAQGYFGTMLMPLLNGWLWERARRWPKVRNLLLLPFLLAIFALHNLLGLALDRLRDEHFCPNFWVIAKKR